MHIKKKELHMKSIINRILYISTSIFCLDANASLTNQAVQTQGLQNDQNIQLSRQIKLLTIGYRDLAVSQQKTYDIFVQQSQDMQKYINRLEQKFKQQSQEVPKLRTQLQNFTQNCKEKIQELSAQIYQSEQGYKQGLQICEQELKKNTKIANQYDNKLQLQITQLAVGIQELRALQLPTQQLALQQKSFEVEQPRTLTRNISQVALLNDYSFASMQVTSNIFDTK